MRLRSVLLTTSIALIAAAPAAQGATWIGPGVESGMSAAQDRPNEVKCYDAFPCRFVQNDWTPGRAGDLALPYPLGGSYVITEVKFPQPLDVRVRVEAVHETDAANHMYTVVDQASTLGAPTAHAIDDEAVRLPLHQGDALAFFLPANAAAIYRNAPGEAGDGSISYVPQQTMTYDFQAQGQPNAGTLDFAVKVEPDADGDGFGDETQDNCPGFAGGDDGCGPGGRPAPAPAPAPTTPTTPTVPEATAPPKPTPRLSALHLTGTRLSYTLTTHVAHLRAKLERRRHGHWHVYATHTLSGTAGRHTTHLPHHHPGDRLVLTASGKAIKIITLPR